MHRVGICVIALAVMAVLTGQAGAGITGVAGPVSSAGTAPAIIAPPPHILDDIVFNTGMQGFNEAQGILTTAPHLHDYGVIAPRTWVSSHMIFLNSQGTGSLSHRQVVWTFDGPILGVMSDVNGTLEAISTFELGNPATNYVATFPGSGPAAPFSARGIEANDGLGIGEGYAVAGNTITVGMGVSEPGDWIRVVTSPIPAPGALLLGSIGVGLIGHLRRRRAL